MSFTAIYSVAVVFSAFFFVGWYLHDRKPLRPKQPESPRHHPFFDDAV